MNYISYDKDLITSCTNNTDLKLKETSIPDNVYHTCHQQNNTTKRIIPLDHFLN